MEVLIAKQVPASYDIYSDLAPAANGRVETCKSSNGPAPPHRSRIPKDLGIDDVVLQTVILTCVSDSG
jgi:hypothetical protein